VLWSLDICSTRALISAHLWECARCLKLKHLFVSTAQKLITSSDENRSVVIWADNRWNAERLDNTTRFRTFNPDTSTHPLGMALPRTAWVRFNHLRTGVRRFRSCLHKWSMASSAACEWAAEEQTAHFLVLQCPIHQPSHGLHGLAVVDDETIESLLNTFPEI